MSCRSVTLARRMWKRAKRASESWRTSKRILGVVADSRMCLRVRFVVALGVVKAVGARVWMSMR
jgi:hypothetical protein